MTHMSDKHPITENILNFRISRQKKTNRKNNKIEYTIRIREHVKVSVTLNSTSCLPACMEISYDFLGEVKKLRIHTCTMYIISHENTCKRFSTPTKSTLNINSNSGSFIALPNKMKIITFFDFQVQNVNL